MNKSKTIKDVSVFRNLNIKQQIILKQIGFYSYSIEYKCRNKFEKLIEFSHNMYNIYYNII